MNSSFMIIGSTGLLGQALMREIKSQNKNVTGIARKNADISVDATEHDALLKVLTDVKPDVIINTAAIVSHELCENDKDYCYAVNAGVSKTVSEYSKKTGCKYVYISTDHYYTGGQDKKHTEQSPLNLCCQYSITKRKGEVYASSDANSLIVRTNIVGFRYDPSRPTFVEWAIGALEQKTKIQLYQDFYTSSIDVRSFSKILMDLIENNACGVFNVASSEVSSKEKFITSLARKLNLSLENTSPGFLLEQNSSIDRNESLGLDVSKAEKVLGYAMPDLQQVINSIADEYLKAKQT